MECNLPSLDLLPENFLFPGYLCYQNDCSSGLSGCVELTDVSKETKIGLEICVSGDNANIISLFSLLFHVAIFSNELEGKIELTPETL